MMKQILTVLTDCTTMHVLIEVTNCTIVSPIDIFDVNKFVLWSLLVNTIIARYNAQTTTSRHAIKQVSKSSKPSDPRTCASPPESGIGHDHTWKMYR